MARYRVVFSKSWLTGRWGYTDRVFAEIGGTPAEPSLVQPVWYVTYRGSALALGRYLTDRLQLPISQDAYDAGAVFEIQDVDAPDPEAGPPALSRRAGRG